jgi:hypothetical protein
MAPLTRRRPGVVARCGPRRSLEWPPNSLQPTTSAFARQSETQRLSRLSLESRAGGEIGV